jgi:hypothetical protein
MGNSNIGSNIEIIHELEIKLINEQEPEIIEQIKRTLKTLNRMDENKGIYDEKDFIHEIEKLERFKRDYENKRILEKIDEEIKIWESIKSCNYSDKSVIFNKNINVDEILKQLNKAKQEKKFQLLETWPLSVEEERIKF